MHTQDMEEPTIQDVVFSPINLPCGRTLKNRLVKVAMYEHLASFPGGPPNDYHYSLYSKWAVSDWGMVITGNVQVSSTHISLGRDMVAPRDLSEKSLRPYRKLASSIHGSSNSGVLAIMQLSHAGRQSANIMGGRPPFKRPLGPSSIRIGTKNLGWLTKAMHALTFQKPRAMSLEDIDDVVEAFVKAAILAKESGFDGIQLHAAHGYLLAQFISPQSNNRADDYCASSLRLLHRIVSAIRKAVAKDFILGIKINSADYVSQSPNDEGRILEHFRTIAQWGEVDFLEVSGGNYERPDFMATRAESPRQALFSRFSKASMEALKNLTLGASCPLILLTGGLRTPELLYSALAQRQAHLLGIGRGSILCPDLPCRLRQKGLVRGSLDPTWSSAFVREPDLDGWTRLQRILPTIPLVGAGINMAWYIVGIRQLALHTSPTGDPSELVKPNHRLGPLGAVFWMWVWVDVGFQCKAVVLILLGIFLVALILPLLP